MAVGYKGYGTPEAAERHRAIADALLGRIFSKGRTPRTYGEAIGQGLKDIGAGWMARGNRKYAEEMEEKGRAKASENRQALIDQLTGKGQRPAPKVEATPSSAPAQGGLPPGLMDATFKVESGGDPNAVSPKGAMGVGQVMPDTARDPGYGVPTVFDVARQMGKPVPNESDATLQTLLRDPEVNKAFSTAYMTAMHREQGGDIDRTLAAYNAGPGAVAQHGGVPPYAETQAYIPKVKAGMESGPVASQTGVPPMPGGGQPPAQTGPQQPDMASIDALTQVLNDPWASPADQQMAQMLLESQIARMQGPAPMNQYQRAQLGLGQQGLALDRAQFEFEKFKHNNPQLPKEAQLYQFAQENPEFAPFLQQMKGGGTRLRVNPQTGEVEFSQGGPGEMTSTSSGSPGLTQLDKDFATEYAAWTTGGQFDAEKNLSQLETAAQNLEQGGNITGAFLGMLPDSVLAVVNPEAVDTKQLVEEVVQRNLRSVLGAQFTEKEGERLIARAYNPQLDEETNRKRLQRLIGQMRDAYEAKNDAARYFQKNGTLRGWEGKIYKSADDFDLTEEGPGNRPNTGTPETDASGGGNRPPPGNYRWNPETGELEPVE